MCGQRLYDSDDWERYRALSPAGQIVDDTGWWIVNALPDLLFHIAIVVLIGLGAVKAWELI